MKLSTKGKYGLYAMLFLARHEGEGPQSLKAIAEAGTPEAYLEQLLGSLRRAELVSTVRGAQGGYRLSRPAEEITARDVLEAVEGPFHLSDCVGEESACARQEDCPAREAWEYLTDQFNALLSGITLRDILDKKLHAIK